jgi:hypothetical protein
MGNNMTKRFKIEPDLTCPELAGYKLPQIECTPIAIEVEMDSTKSLLGVWTGFVPALNPDGTVKGRYIYE